MTITEYPGRNPLAPISGSATQEMTSVDFWNLNDTILMNLDEIEKYNQYLEGEKDLGLLNLLTAPHSISKAELVEMITKGQSFDDLVYLADEKVTPADIKDLEDSQALESIPDQVTVSCGLAACPADLRYFPTTKAGTEDGSFISEKCIDQLQGTQLTLAEPVLIYHTSEDKKWLFVHSKNYKGWVKRICIATCQRSIWEDYLLSPRFAIVTEHKSCDVLGVKMKLYVGTKISMDMDGNLRIPTRTIDGGLRFVNTKLDIDMHQGFLHYTTKNVVTQAFKLLGDQFSWGGKYGHSDCSGIVNAVYNCFGFTLPRDTIDMRKIKKHSIDPTGGIDYNSVQPGSLLLCPGHVMLYLGMHDGKAYGFHGLASILDDSGKLLELYRVEISNVDMIRSETGRTYEQDTVLIVEIKRDEA